MKKFIHFLRTTLTREIKTSVGYTIFQLLVIIWALFSVLSLSFKYFSYRIEVEELRKIDNIKIELYEGYFDKQLNKINNKE